MCFYFRTSQKVLDMLGAKYNIKEAPLSSTFHELNNGFTHPDTPVVTNKEPGCVQFFNWGLIPYWAKDRSIQNSTLNAKIETLKEKPSFKNYLGNRCLIFADGFYEWQWLDEKGKRKQPYLITLPQETPFSFAGIWNQWIDPLNGIKINTYTIITAPANALMSEIHNSKKRMPWILSASEETAYLNGNLPDVNNHIPLIARPIHPDTINR